MNRRRLASGALVLLLQIACNDSDGPLESSGSEFEVVDLSTVLDTTGLLMDFNDSHQFVGSFSDTAFNNYAALWTLDGQRTDIFTDLPTPWDTFTQAINNRGQVVGFFIAPAPPGEDRPWGAFLWDDGSIALLEGPDGLPLTPQGLNDAGQIVGLSRPEGQPHRAFVMSNGTFTDLGTPSGSSEAWDVNEQGLIVGASAAADGRARAVLWSAGSVTELGALPGFSSSTASAISTGNPPIIVGYSEDSTGTRFATGWRLAGTEVQVLNLAAAAGPGSSTARDVNDRGEVAGFRDDHRGYQRPVLWRIEGDDITAVDLAANGAALAINDAGDVLGTHAVPVPGDFGRQAPTLWRRR